MLSLHERAMLTVTVQCQLNITPSVPEYQSLQMPADTGKLSGPGQKQG